MNVIKKRLALLGIFCYAITMCSCGQPVKQNNSPDVAVITNAGTQWVESGKKIANSLAKKVSTYEIQDDFSLLWEEIEAEYVIIYTLGDRKGLFELKNGSKTYIVDCMMIQELKKNEKIKYVVVTASNSNEMVLDGDVSENYCIYLSQKIAENGYVICPTGSTYYCREKVLTVLSHWNVFQNGSLVKCLQPDYSTVEELINAVS